MEHIYFEAQICIDISKSKEISNIDILIILALATSLSDVRPSVLVPEGSPPGILLGMSRVWYGWRWRARLFVLSVIGA